MIKALFLILEPEAAWARVVEARRSLKFIFGWCLLPMLLAVAVAEGFGLMKWGKWHSITGQLKVFSAGEALIYETAQTLLMVVVVAACAYLIKALGETFHGRHSQVQAFTVAVHGLSPLFLFRLLDAFPAINPWLTWLIGVLLAVKVLYHGVPLVMQPDPPHAFGLYFMSSLLLIMVTGLERFITAWYLAGRCPQAEQFVAHLAARLPF